MMYKKYERVKWTSHGRACTGVILTQHRNGMIEVLLLTVDGDPLRHPESRYFTTEDLRYA